MSESTIKAIMSLDANVEGPHNCVFAKYSYSISPADFLTARPTAFPRRGGTALPI